jgi:glycosyltransferase involved in cell wall biosynthesis
MKIYLDGLFYKGSGIGRYYESLTKEFAKRGIKVYTCLPEKFRDDFEKDFSGLNNIEPIFVDYEKFSIKGFFKQSEILRKFEDEIDLFFYPSINLPCHIPKKTIVTIHDLIPLSQFWDRNEIKRKIFIFYLRRALRYSMKIVTDSNTIANELKQKFKCLNKNIEVIYLFIDDKFANYNPLNKRRIIDKPYLLFVGNRKKHKNLKFLVKAFAKIKAEIPHYLVIAGTKNNDNETDDIDILVENLNIQNRIIQLIKPDDDTIINLYLFADLFVFPSLFEGFGLPPLEAVILGCPVILSDIPILREIFSDAGLYFNPYSEDNLSNAILKVILDDKLKLAILDKQKQRMKIFDKDKIINQYIQLFGKIKENS